MSNNIKATAKVGETRIKMDYEWNGDLFTIEVPRTMNNVNMQDGEVVQVLLTVMPVEDEAVFEAPKLEGKLDGQD